MCPAGRVAAANFGRAFSVGTQTQAGVRSKCVEGFWSVIALAPESCDILTCGAATVPWSLLSFGRDSDKTVDIRLRKAHGKETKLRRCIKATDLSNAALSGVPMCLPPPPK